MTGNTWNKRKTKNWFYVYIFIKNIKSLILNKIWNEELPKKFYKPYLIFTNKHIKVYKIIIKTIKILCKIQLQKIIHNNSTLVLVEKKATLVRTDKNRKYQQWPTIKNLKQLTTPNRAWIQSRHSPTYCTNNNGNW